MVNMEFTEEEKMILTSMLKSYYSMIESLNRDGFDIVNYGEATISTNAVYWLANKLGIDI